MRYCAGRLDSQREPARMDFKTLLEAELMDCRSQRDQQSLLLAQAQSTLANATINIHRCDGAERQLLALIDKLSTPEPTGSTLAQTEVPEAG